MLHPPALQRLPEAPLTRGHPAPLPLLLLPTTHERPHQASRRRRMLALHQRGPGGGGQPLQHGDGCVPTLPSHPRAFGSCWEPAVPAAVPADFSQVLRHYTADGFRVLALACRPLSAVRSFEDALQLTRWGRSRLRLQVPFGLVVACGFGGGWCHAARCAQQGCGGEQPDLPGLPVGISLTSASWRWEGGGWREKKKQRSLKTELQQ